MRPYSRHPAFIAGAALLAVLFVGAVGVFLASPPSSRAGAIAIGVASSLLASLAFALFDGLLTGNRREELREELEIAEGLSRCLSLQGEATEHEIRSVKPKIAYSEAEWLDVLKGAQQSLTMVGHALDKWCEGEIKKEFAEAIRRVVANNGEVRLLMLAEKAHRVPKLRSKRYTERIERTLRILRAVNGELVGPGKLNVYHLGDKLDMPYMAVANDGSVITAPYPATAQSSNRMPAVCVSTESVIAKQLGADIDALLEGEVTKAKL